MWLRSVLVLLCGMICVQLGASLQVIALFNFCIRVLSPELALFVHMMSGTHPSGAHTMFLSLLFFLLMIACGQTYANISG